ncbi:hypothetical protein RDI58_014858 [Solanum bulbocastanum]|uniref:Uncharacterized protein n=1 Tax=Solanum bulbocastanum TaxID=147425 RepID=A0AAN8TD57_SOLBU
MGNIIQCCFISNVIVPIIVKTDKFTLKDTTTIPAKTKLTKTNINKHGLQKRIILLLYSSDGEANNYKGVGFSRAGGCGGIPSLPIRGPFPSAHGQEPAPNGRFLVFLTRPYDTAP